MDSANFTNNILLRQSIFKIGVVHSVDGREIKIKVDKEKNNSHLLYKGKLLKNVTVGGYVKIRKGFVSIISKVEGEFVKESTEYSEEYKKETDKIDRYLIVKLLGFIESDEFNRGIKEMPLVGNECYLLNASEFTCIHEFVDIEDFPLKIGTLALESGQDISIGVNSIFASHIGIFGNTGSGKSYTLAKLYRLLCEKFKDNHGFKEKVRFFLFDFNDEYSGDKCITENKKVYNLSTRKLVANDTRERFPLNEKDLISDELISILADATEKTQKPFISRALKFYKKVHDSDEPEIYFQNTLRNRVKDILGMADKGKAFLLLDYVRTILPVKLDDEFGIEDSLEEDIEWNGTFNYWMVRGMSPCHALTDDEFKATTVYQHISNYSFPEDCVSKIIHFLYLQLIFDVFYNKAQNEHIAPAINKLRSKKESLEKVLDTHTRDVDIWKDDNFIVLNLHDVNLDMKKTIPLLLSKKIYSEHKYEQNKKSLNIIVDEAHNILSRESFREADSWKDYRLETFEEIIKEGRKFGVFLTIASQRPSDISSTIISQLHNYFLHRLINERDIEAVGRIISYLDKVSVDALHILPTGTCVLAGLFAQNPVIVSIDEIEKEHEPKNKTIDILKQILSEQQADDVFDL